MKHVMTPMSFELENGQIYKKCRTKYSSNKGKSIIILLAGQNTIENSVDFILDYLYYKTLDVFEDWFQNTYITNYTT